jgi:uncharacterized protein Yka (UPF0111/DUF47 family)
MSTVARLATAVEELGKAIYDRFVRNEDRIEKLEQEIERLKREPRQSFKQKLQERNR